MNDKKILGDAAEHYALSQFGFAGLPCSKLPDNWRYYDLIVQKNNSIIRVSVKSRSESESFSKNSWFIFDATGQYEWLVFIVKFADGQLRSWIIPVDEALKYAKAPGDDTKSPNARRLSWGKLEAPELVKYVNNWMLEYV
jgi:hypothetical protein